MDALAPFALRELMSLPNVPEYRFRLSVILAACLAMPCAAAQDSKPWDRDAALAHSQAAIGNPLPDLELTNSDGRRVSLADFRGKPVLVSLIFTSCHHVCPTTTRRLAEAVSAARKALGDDSFNVLTIGFDTANDTPAAMRGFARQQSVSEPGWDFLSATPEAIRVLSDQLGFVFYPSPRGFDHLTQVSVFDRDGTLYRQVYGMQFELPWLVEPLKELVYDRRVESHGLMAGLLDRIRLFCTTYDPASDRYHFDYSLFIQLLIGFAAIAGVAIFLVRGSRRSARD